MQTEDIFAMGLGPSYAWKVASQRLDTDYTPLRLHLELGADVAHGTRVPSVELCARLMISRSSHGGKIPCPGIPKRGEFHHYGLPDCGPDSVHCDFMNSTSNSEEPNSYV